MDELTLLIVLGILVIFITMVTEAFVISFKPEENVLYNSINSNDPLAAKYSLNWDFNWRGYNSFGKFLKKKMLKQNLANT